jgi:hypothetical protein
VPAEQRVALAKNRRPAVLVHLGPILRISISDK